MPKDILIVDDSLPIRRMLVNVLSSVGHRVTEAESGLMGATLAADRRFDVIITDVNMPEMDGFQLVQHLRSLPDYRFAPIIFLTTESPDEFRVKAKAAGASAWLTKPFSPQDLLNVVHKF